MSKAIAKRRATSTADVLSRAELIEARNRVALARVRAKVIAVQAGSAKALGDYSRTANGSRPRTATGYAPRTNSGQYNLDRRTHSMLRAECQRLMRRNPIARAMIARQVNTVVKSGFAVQSQAKVGTGKGADEEATKTLRDQYEAVFTKWAIDNKWARTQRLAYKAKRVDGDVLLVLSVTPDMQPYVQTIEGELIGSPNPLPAGLSKDLISEGIEKNEFGQVVAYWVGKWTSGGGGVDLSNPTRIDAKVGMYLSNESRASSDRGEPGLVAVIDILEHLDKFVEATVIAARLAAMQALVIKSQFPSSMQDSLLANVGGRTQTDADGSSRNVNLWEPGAVWSLKPGEELEQVKPEHPGTQFDSFARLMVRFCGADQAMSLEMCLIDMSQANYASAKLAFMHFYEFVDHEQDDFMNTVSRRVWAWVIGLAILRGEVAAAADFDAVRVLRPRRPMLDVAKETPALIARIDKNLMTMRDAIEENGDDVDAVFAQRKREIDGQREKGILPVVAGAAVAGPAAGP